jgi:hypothetical protein
MHRFPRRSARLLPLLAAAALSAPLPGLAGEGLGTEAPFQFQPEADVYKHLSDDLRLVLQVPGTWQPSDGYSDVQFNGFVSFLVAPVYDHYLSPDVAKVRNLELRAGAGYYTVTTAGDPDPLQRFILMAEATPRGFLPLGIAFQLRNRYEARWQLDAAHTFTQRLRFRLQLEHDFVLPGASGSALTPYLNGEVIWSTSVDKWQQARVLAGLVWAVKWWGKGQSFEVNGGLFTTLAPSRSTAPVLGLVVSQYFD